MAQEDRGFPGLTAKCERLGKRQAWVPPGPSSGEARGTPGSEAVGPGLC